MFRAEKKLLSMLSLAVSLLLTSTAYTQEKSKDETLHGQPVLWEQVDVGSQNLILGPGGEEMRPDLSRVAFIKKEEGGTNEKYRIKDGKGQTWVSKTRQRSAV